MGHSKVQHRGIRIIHWEADETSKFSWKLFGKSVANDYVMFGYVTKELAGYKTSKTMVTVIVADVLENNDSPVQQYVKVNSRPFLFIFLCVVTLLIALLFR